MKRAPIIRPYRWGFFPKVPFNPVSFLARIREEEKQQEPLSVNFKFHENTKSNSKLKDKVQELEKRLLLKSNQTKTKSFVLKEESVGLDKIEEVFKTLCEMHGNEENKKFLSEQDNITIEEYKLTIIKSVLSSPQFKKTETLSQVVVPKVSIWRTPCYIFLMVSNVLFMAIGGFLGMQEMLVDIFPKISALLLNSVSGILTFFECVMCYSIMAPYLKKGLGIPEELTAGELLTIYDEQREATKQLNNRLAYEPKYYDRMSLSMYENYARVVTIFNNHLVNIKVKEFKESIFKMGIRWFFSGINILLTVTNAFFMASALLKGMAATLVGTPVGLAIEVAIIAIQVINSFAIRSESVYEMLNPNALKPKVDNTPFKEIHLRFNFIETEKMNFQELKARRRSDRLRSVIVWPSSKKLKDLPITASNQSCRLSLH